MKKKLILLVVLLCTIIALFTGCQKEEVPERMISREKALYARQMHFDFRIVTEDGTHLSYEGRGLFGLINPDSLDFDPFFTELVFVHSEEEAEGFPDNIIVAWPSWQTERMVEMFNLWAKAPEQDWRRSGMGQSDGLLGEVYRYLPEHNLTWPISAADLVDNWEDVEAFLKRLNPSLRSSMTVRISVDRPAPTLEEFLAQFE